MAGQFINSIWHSIQKAQKLKFWVTNKIYLFKDYFNDIRKYPR